MTCRVGIRGAGLFCLKGADAEAVELQSCYYILLKNFQDMRYFILGEYNAMNMLVP
jgi:hypothetical protein